MLSIIPEDIHFSKPDQIHKNRIIGEIIYIGLMALALLSHIWMIVINAGNDSIPIAIWFLRLVPVPFAFFLGKLWKDRGFQILLVYFMLFVFRCYLQKQESIFSEEEATSILSALWLFCACYGLGYVLSGKRLQKYLSFCSAFLTVGIVVLCCFGIHAAWTDKTIKTIGDGWIGYYVDPRLNLVYLATTTGSLLGIAILVAIMAMSATTNIIGKKLYFISLFPMILALALTDSHTAYISLPIGVGIVVAVLFVYQRRRNESICKQKHIFNWGIRIIIMIIVSIILFLGIMQITPAFNMVKLRGIIPYAYAEKNDKMAVVYRGLNGSQLLSGRVEIWTTCMDYIKNNPLVLLIGKSKIYPLHDVNPLFSHCHSLYVQILLESGIPGVLLVVYFIIYTIRKSIKDVDSWITPLWIKLLPAIPIYLWIGDIVECFSWLRSSQCPMITILFISVGIINAQQYGFPKVNNM